MKYELDHLIESTQFRIDDIDTYFKRVETEYFLKDKKNEFYVELSSYNSQIQDSLKKLKSIYDGVTIYILLFFFFFLIIFIKKKNIDILLFK
ncbi:hypothetical protein DDB_G0288997 [Dictyostelium discoideum AX4]|uniref:hypothetical protein n=1 Tax=Dictyostelium discoideum AX4 TaxID=352472 RepID=UPI00004E3F16|nr:hypothetical protein DDB_G0288997 [Dictyostelium discoideum AX4]EAL62953.1 hypothetical protein DDB_G0288997 [Dictyostelium discoideum AX4]|eukprot:XP_636456.1 hypothetical protein DDB_G0288997 [Dictyostelium discoideum AX4]